MGRHARDVIESRKSQRQDARLRFYRGGLLCLISLLVPTLATATVYQANPSNYATHVSRLKPGDTLSLAAGTYRGLIVTHLNGNSNAWIVITGPASGPPAMVIGSACCNTIEISNSSFVSIEHLTIDSKGIEGTFGVSAKDGLNNRTHDIRIQNDRFIGQSGSQQTVAISTKTPTWGWIIRENRIENAGTGIYLGNSDGTLPFVAGVIENNLIENTIGYNIEIKWQRPRPAVPGMPAGQSSTIIRHNVFIKDGRPSPDGDRPNMLVGGFPETGAGSTDMYELYGNLFVNNPREALLQASGRISVHDNIFLGGDYASMALQSQELPLKLAHVYNNTIYTRAQGILFGSAAAQEDAVIGNLVFAAEPLSGPVKHAADNILETPAHIAAYVKTPGLDLTADLFPLPGKCMGRPLDLTPFATETDYALDFNANPKRSAKGEIVFRGAYAGEGANPGWKLQLGMKSGAAEAAPRLVALELSPSTGKRGGSGSFLILLHAPQGANITGLQWELSSAEITVDPADIVIGSAAASAEKRIVCSSPGTGAGRPPTLKCLLAGGQKRISDGPVAIVRYHVGRQVRAGTAIVVLDKILAVTTQTTGLDLGRSEGTVSIQ